MMSRIHAPAILAIACACAAPSRCEEPRAAGFDGYRLHLQGLYEGFYGGGDNLATPPAEALTGQVSSQGHVYHVEARIAVAATLTAPIYEPPAIYYRHYTRRHEESGFGLPELNLRYRFGAPGSRAGLQLGVFPVRAESRPDLFGNFLVRHEPYPGGAPSPNPMPDTLGSVSATGFGLRAAFGESGSPLRAEAIVLGGLDYSFLGYLDGTAFPGLEWGLGGGVLHAFSHSRYWISPPFMDNGWAKTDTGYVPLELAKIQGLAFSDSGYYSRRALVFSARLDWNTDAGWGAFGEMALLGWKNQPILYEDRWRRLAATAGLRIPTGGWLQPCLLQAEWLPNAYHPTRFIPAGSDETGYLEAGDGNSPWSYGLLIGRQAGRHWQFYGRVLWAPQVWSESPFGWTHDEPMSDPNVHRGARQWAFQIRALFRAGSL